MAITDLTGYTWVGNDRMNLIEGTNSFYITFTSNNEMYGTIIIDNRTIGIISFYSVTYLLLDSSRGDFVYNGEWFGQAYKTIEITGGTDATNPDLIAWLEANGTLTKGGGGWQYA